MIIHEPEPYKNKNGTMEKPKQYFYFNEYRQLPPPLRTINNLYQVLQDKEAKGQLPWKLNKIKTLYEYKNKFDWDERILREVGTKNQTKQIINTDYFYQQLWEDLTDYQELTREQKKKLRAWKNTPIKDTSTIRNLNDTQKTYDQSLRTLIGGPVSMAEMYAMMEVLSQAVQGDEDRMSVLESLLDTEEEEEDDDDEE